MYLQQRSAAAAVAVALLLPWSSVQGFVVTAGSRVLANHGAVKTQNEVAQGTSCHSTSSISQRANSRIRVFMGTAGAAEEGEEAEVVVIGSGIAG